MYPMGFEPTISAEKWPQTYTLDRAAIEIAIQCENWDEFHDYGLAPS
jgi:hypothetical protein